jgi:hypothetical protein
MPGRAQDRRQPTPPRCSAKPARQRRQHGPLARQTLLHPALDSPQSIPPSQRQAHPTNDNIIFTFCITLLIVHNFLDSEMQPMVVAAAGLAPIRLLSGHVDAWFWSRLTGRLAAARHSWPTRGMIAILGSGAALTAAGEPKTAITEPHRQCRSVALSPAAANRRLGPDGPFHDRHSGHGTALRGRCFESYYEQ